MSDINRKVGKTKVDWSTPYDEWLIPLLNKARHAGAIEFRAIPSVVQIEIDKIIAEHDQALRTKLIEALPEKAPNPAPDSKYNDGLIEGWNDALEEVIQMITDTYGGSV